MRFRTVVELSGRTATGMEVPADVVSALGTSRRPAVTVTLAGHTYRSTIARMGGRFLIPVSADVRAASGVAAGDEVDVVVELDDAPRVVEVPADLAAALDGEPRRRFDALPLPAPGLLRRPSVPQGYSAQRRHVLAVDGAKAAATRERRIAAVLAELS